MNEEKQTIDTIIPDWRERIEQNKKCTYLTEVAELLPIMKQLIIDRNEKAILEFYNKVDIGGFEWSDRDPSLYTFVQVFCNMKACQYVKIKDEPLTKNNYLCFKCIYHRGKEDEFSVIRFIKKDTYYLHEFIYKSFLTCNNLVGMETFLHTYEFNMPIFEEKYMVQCNNLVLSFKLEGTDKEDIVNPKTYLDDICLDFLEEILINLGLKIRTILVNGEDLTIIIDLWRSVTLKSNTLKYILNKVEKELLLKFKDCHIYDNEHFFMVPGSINSRKPVVIERKSALLFQNREIKKEGYIDFKSSGYKRCYYMDYVYYHSAAVSLTELAETLGYPKKENKRTTQHIEYYKRFYKVGKERLQDLDELIALRGNNISERFNLFRVMANILFYLNHEPSDVLAYISDKNKTLSSPVSETCLLRIFTFCLEDYEKYLQNPTQGIKYTNRKIFELLNIKNHEQIHLKQLINQDEAEKRAHESHLNTMRRSYAPIKMENEAKKDAIIKELLDMRNQGMSNKQIADCKGWYLKKVTRLIGKDIKSSTLEEQIEKYVNDGKTVSEISELLNISISKVYRIKKKLLN